MNNTPLETQEELVIFPKPICVGLIAGSGMFIVFGSAVTGLAATDGEWVISPFGVILAAIGLVSMVALTRKRDGGNPDPTLILSPRGLPLSAGVTRVIPWRAVRGVSPFSRRHVRGRKMKLDEQDLAALDQGKIFTAARMLDAAISVHAVVFLQQQLELSVQEDMHLLDRYSADHGGAPFLTQGAR